MGHCPSSALVLSWERTSTLLGALVCGLSGVADGFARSLWWRDRLRYILAYRSIDDVDTPHERRPHPLW
jgi:hypothetical protein